MINVAIMKSPQRVKRKSWLGFGLIPFVGLVLLAYLLTPVRVLGNSMNPTLHDGQLLFLQRHQSFLDYRYKRDDIVVFRPPEELPLRASRYVKRVVAVPGESLSIRADVIYLNGQKLTEPYVTQHSSLLDNFPEVIVSKGEVVAFEGFALAELPDYLQDTLAILEPLPKDILEQSQNENVTYVGTIKLKEDFYFVLGDNRGFSASEDSRLFGVISAKNILGTARAF
jgi:signal peptidase I